jgi:hypothetical protein
MSDLSAIIIINKTKEAVMQDNNIEDDSSEVYVYLKRPFLFNIINRVVIRRRRNPKPDFFINEFNMTITVRPVCYHMKRAVSHNCGCWQNNKITRWNVYAERT